MSDPPSTRIGADRRALISQSIRDEQRRRWQAGDRVSAEALLTGHPEIAADPEAAVDVIYGEYLIRERMDEIPDEAEFLARFPQHAATLRDQIALHRALDEDGPIEPTGRLTSTHTEPGAPDDRDDRPESFGRYRVIERIGRGGMGTVYVAHDPQLDRRVALKVPRLGDDPDGRSAEWFRREARIAATFSHPNLCPIFDVGEDRGVLFFTMPLLLGETLAERLSRFGGLPSRQAAALVAKMARALAEAHRSGVTHRDLKPSNVMIDPRGEPIVMDFGLAHREAREGESLTPRDRIVGTPAYMAPELIEGDTSASAVSGDIYGLGVILYQMLRGDPPYSGTFSEVVRRSLEGRPEPPSRSLEGVDPAVEAICLKAMARDPEARFATMSELAEALERLPRLPERTPRFGPRPRLLAIVLLFASLPLAAWGIMKATADPSASLVAGSRWVGSFQFRPHDYSSDVELRIMSRHGTAFTADYVTEGGAYAWECRGEVRGSEIRWDFTRVIREKGPTDVVGNAFVHGRISGDLIDPLIFDHGEQGIADMRLVRATR
jgi:serine/threonine protein kinase